MAEEQGQRGRLDKRVDWDLVVGEQPLFEVEDGLFFPKGNLYVLACASNGRVFGILETRGRISEPLHGLHGKQPSTHSIATRTEQCTTPALLYSGQLLPLTLLKWSGVSSTSRNANRHPFRRNN